MKLWEKIGYGLTMALMVVNLYLIFLWVPNEKTMGIVQRIFYFHVPSAWVSFYAFGVVFAGSLMYLIRRNFYWDALAEASAELGLLFCTMMLTTGPIWAKPVWGIWWTWDARLTSTLVLWLIYLAYLMLRTSIDDPAKRARLSAVVGIVGFLQVPLVYMSIRWWRTQHPAPVIGGGDKSGLAPEMAFVLWFSFFTFVGVFTLLLRKRMAVARQAMELESLRRQVQVR